MRVAKRDVGVEAGRRRVPIFCAQLACLCRDRRRESAGPRGQLDADELVGADATCERVAPRSAQGPAYASIAPLDADPRERTQHPRPWRSDVSCCRETSRSGVRRARVLPRKFDHVMSTINHHTRQGAASRQRNSVNVLLHLPRLRCSALGGQVPWVKYFLASSALAQDVAELSRRQQPLAAVREDEVLCARSRRRE